MKVELVGWTTYYKGMPDIIEMHKDSADMNALVWNAEKAIKDDIIKNKYKFSGEYHQYGYCGTPVVSVDDGTVGAYTLSFRGWGGFMAECWNDIEHACKYDYMDFYMNGDANVDNFKCCNVQYAFDAKPQSLESIGVNQLIAKRKALDEQIDNCLLKIVKDTYCPEASYIASYKPIGNINDADSKIEVEYVLFAADSHTCVDFNEKCTIPSIWTTPGYDYMHEYYGLAKDDAKKRIEELQDSIEQHEETIEDERIAIDEAQKKIEDLKRQLSELEAKDTNGKVQTSRDRP